MGGGTLFPRKKRAFSPFPRYFRLSHCLQWIGQGRDHDDEEEGEHRVLPKFSGVPARRPLRGLGPFPWCCFEECGAGTGVEPPFTALSEVGITTYGWYGKSSEGGRGLSCGKQRRRRKSSGGGAIPSGKETGFSGSGVKSLSNCLLLTNGSFAARTMVIEGVFSCAGSIKSPKSGGAGVKRD